MKLTEKAIFTTLRKNGYKVTPQRRVVIRAIADSDDRLTPAEIYGIVNRNQPGIGLVTIYRTLEVLSALNLVCQLHTGNGGPSYTLSVSRHHHHLVCSGCGKVVDFIGHDLEDLENRLTRESGFIIEDHILEFIGRCRACQNTVGSPSDVKV